MSRFLDNEVRYARIIGLMQKRGFRSMAHLAEVAGMNRGTLWRSLRSDNLTLATILKVADALGCRAGYLIDVR